MKLFIIVLTTLVSLQPAFSKTDDDYYLKTNRSFELYGSIFKELNKNYVLDIDPEALMTDGINGMLSSLDPYTVFMDASESEDIDVLTSGSYVGLGISVGNRDSLLTVTGVYEGYSAFQNGIRIGDRIYKIDTNIILYESSDNIRKFTRGAPNSVVNVWLLRDGRKDTLKLELTRREIEVKNISYFGLASKDIGYIRIDRFSRFSAIEVKNALNELKNKYNIRGLILDLRNNPGGLLDAAIGISELFLPEGSEIVSTRGRNGTDEIIYKSMRSAHDTTLPLAVLINEFSASASEVLAGAIQDHDRGIILGRRSYGKGLVQTIIELPHNSSLKMTTARYYTPSGRCIQRLEYSSKNGDKIVREITSDSVFYTKNGRKVYESKGIMPDSVIKVTDFYSPFISRLIVTGHIFNFANNFASKLDKLPTGFVVDKSVVDQFRDFLKLKGFSWEPPIIQNLKALKVQADSVKATKEVLTLINKLEKMLLKEKSDPFTENFEYLKKLLELEIKSRFLSESELIKYSLENEIIITASVNLLNPEQYKILLSNGSGNNIKKMN
jgi:carboxyl-terminal processing protease